MPLSLVHLPNCKLPEVKHSPGDWRLTEERCEGLGCFEEVAGGDGIVVVGLDRDIVESFMERVEPGST